MMPATKTHFCTTHRTTHRSFRSAAKLGLGLLSLLSLSAGTVASAAPVTWSGPTGADWFSNPSYWSNGSTPGAGDDAQNNTTSSMTLGQSTTINSFFSSGAFTLQGGTFSGSQASAGSTITVNNVFTDNGGGISNFTVQPGAGGSVVFGNSGSNFIDSDIFNADVTLTNDSYTRLYNTNTFNGAINLSTTSNGIQLQDSNANLILGSTGSLNGFGNIYQVYDGTVTNNGLVNANSAANTLSINTDHFNNSGTAEATAAGSVLTLNSSGTNTGTFAASGGGTLNIHSGITSGAGSAYNAAGGTILIDGGNLTGTVGSTTGTGLTFSNNGNNYLSGATINGTLTFSALDAYTRLYGTITENGAINIGTTSNGIQLQDSNTNLINNGSLLGYGTIYQVYDGTVTNNGTINANSPGNALTFNVDHTNNNAGAILEATGGILNLNNNTTNSGMIAAGTGSTVNIANNFVSNAGSLLDGANGTFNLQDVGVTGTVTGTAGTVLNFGNDGRNSINYGSTGTTLNVDTSFAADAYTRLYGVVTNNNTIHFASTSNGIQLQDSNTNLILGSTGSLNGFGNIYQVYDGTVTNNGLVNASGGTLNINTDHFVNTGTTEVQNGAALSVTSANTDSGNILVKQGGTATFTQGLTQTGGLTQVDGTLNSPLTLTGGTLAGTGTVVGNVANSGGTVSAGSSASPFGTLAVSGTFSQNSGALAVGFSSTQNSLLAVNGAVTTGGLLDVNYLSADPYTGTGPFTFLDYGSLTSSLTGTGPTQYFSNETFDSSGNGLIAGSNGFVYELLNTTNIDNTGIDGLQLEVLQNGAPTPAVPEASTTVSMGLLLLLGGGGLVIARRRRTAAAS